jgi:hypothetical protein
VHPGTGMLTTEEQQRKIGSAKEYLEELGLPPSTNILGGAEAFVRLDSDSGTSDKHPITILATRNDMCVVGWSVFFYSLPLLNNRRFWPRLHQTYRLLLPYPFLLLRVLLP